MPAGPTAERRPAEKQRTRERPEGKVAVVTGTSRDVGKFVVYGLSQAEYGWIVGGFQNPAHLKDQTALAEDVYDHYRTKLVHVQGDFTQPEVIAQYLEQAQSFGRGVDTLILNGAGGYRRRISDPDEPWGKVMEQFAEAHRINVETSLKFVDTFREVLNPGASIIFATSEPAHTAHLHAQDERQAIEFYEDYGPVAFSKNRAEGELRELIPGLSERQIRLAIVVGNGLEGSFVTGRLKQSQPKTAEEWLGLTEDGLFPIIMEMSVGMVKVARIPRPSGHTEYVGVAKENWLYDGNILRPAA